MMIDVEEEIGLRDADLPGLPLILNPHAVARASGRPAMRIDYLRYKTGTSCVVTLLPRGDVADLHSVVTVMAYTRDRYAEVRTRPEWNSPGVRFLNDACIALVPPAFDRDLNLRKLAMPGGKLLHRLGMPRHGEARVLRYKPGRRLVLRLEDGEGNAAALLKVYHPDAFAPALAGAIRAAGLGGAEILHVDEGRQAITTKWISGSSLCPSAGVENAEGWFFAGQALARVHSSSERAERRITAESDFEKIEQHLRDFTALQPDAAARAAHLLPTLRRALAPVPHAKSLVHGDFSADQVIVTDTGAHILDWDRSGQGDPGRDIGSFLARLDVQLIDGLLDGASHRLASNAFLAGYGTGIDRQPESSGAHHLRALLTLLGEGFRLRLDDWPTRDAQIISRAEGLEARLRLGDHRSEEKLLKRALDPVEMAHELAACSADQSTDCPEVVLLRHKPGRRALLRYRLAQPEGQKKDVLGKFSAKGPDTRTAKLHGALRAAGLDGTQPHRVGIPQARGSLPDLHMWFQDLVPGRPVAEFLIPGAATTPARQAGAALAHLHATPPATERIWTMTEEVKVLERALSSARARLPNHAMTLGTISDGLRQAALSLGPAPTVGLHRDYYQDQILIDGSRSWIIDLDLYARGDAAIDIGNFLAHLDELGLRIHGDASVLDAHSKAFLAGYHDIRPSPEPGRLTLLRRLSLARHIKLSGEIAGRGHTTLPLIELCRSYLA